MGLFSHISEAQRTVASKKLSVSDIIAKVHDDVAASNEIASKIAKKLGGTVSKITVGKFEYANVDGIKIKTKKGETITCAVKYDPRSEDLVFTMNPAILPFSGDDGKKVIGVIQYITDDFGKRFYASNFKSKDGRYIDAIETGLNTESTLNVIEAIISVLKRY